MEKLEKIIEELKSNSNESTIKRYRKNDEVEPYFGVLMGTISKIAKKYSKDHDLFMPLFRTNNLDCQLLAVQIGNANALSKDEVNEVISNKLSIQVIDKLSDKLLYKRDDIDEIIDETKKSHDLKIKRFYWNFIINKLHDKKFSKKEVEVLLQTIEKELGEAQEPEKWAMNHAFVEIALSYPEYLDRVLESSNKIKAYEDMKVSKGCTSAFAPSWINAVLKNKK